MNKKKRTALTLPIAYQDSSADLDRRLSLLADLLSVAGNESESLEHESIQELGSELHKYLRARAALDVCFGRTMIYDDEEFKDMVRANRKRLTIS